MSPSRLRDGTGSGVRCYGPGKGVSSRTDGAGSVGEGVSRRPGGRGVGVAPAEWTPSGLQRGSLLDVSDRGASRRLPDPGDKSALVVGGADGREERLTSRVTRTSTARRTPVRGTSVWEGECLTGTDDT